MWWLQGGSKYQTNLESGPQHSATLQGQGPTEKSDLETSTREVRLAALKNL
jgi:hypothetical protein